MTREELRDYVEEERSLNNIPYHVYSALIDGIDTLEQEPILDKIRAEIERKANSGQWSEATVYGMQKAITIINKYRKEEQ